MFVKISDEVIIQYDTKNEQLEKYHYQESEQKINQKNTLGPVLRKTISEILFH